VGGDARQARSAGVGALGGLTWYARKAPSVPPWASMNFVLSAASRRARTVTPWTLDVAFNGAPIVPQ
jgi:hypothetical protein